MYRHSVRAPFPRQETHEKRDDIRHRHKADWLLREVVRPTRLQAVNRVLWPWKRAERLPRSEPRADLAAFRLGLVLRDSCKLVVLVEGHFRGSHVIRLADRDVIDR